MNEKEIIEKYKKRLEEQIPGSVLETPTSDEEFSKEYSVFRDELLSEEHTFYEKACAWSESIIKIAPKEKDLDKLQKSIEIAHLGVTPQGAASFASFVGFSMLILGILVGGLFFAIGSPIIFLPMVLILGGVFIIGPLTKYPNRIANRWRLEASNQMVMCVLYVVMYMRHTSNLENAIRFAGKYIGAPLSLDFRKVLWDVEVGTFSNIQNSLDFYLESWRGYNLEFVESFHLIESSLYESDNKRRISLLDKALEVMLEGTYEKMLHYAHYVKAPITILHMLGIILPILGLIIIPLLGTLLGVKWYHLALVYNIILPIGVFYIGTNILAQRPSGQGSMNILRENPKYKDYRKLKLGEQYVDPKGVAFVIIFLVILISSLPLILNLIGAPDISLGDRLGDFMGFREVTRADGTVVTAGPFGLGATLLSLLLPLGVALGLSFYYKTVSKRLIVIREEAVKLEKEFASSLFQLGNRIGEGIPVEVAFQRVAQNMKGTPTGAFFSLVNLNIRKLGMSVKDAVFNSKNGAILSFPSSLIVSTMQILIEAARKGTEVVSNALISISNYVKNINNVNERLKDLLADILSSMTSQIKFLTPVIAGVVVGIGTMITTVIGLLDRRLALAGAQGSEGIGDLGSFLTLFPADKIMPPYFFQLVVGFYVVEIVFILTILANGIENGVDELRKENRLGNNLYKSSVFYFIVALVFIMAFHFLATMIEGNIGGI